MFYHLATLLPCSVCLIYGIHLLCKWKENTKPQNILAFCFLVASLSLFTFVNHLTAEIDYSTYYIFDSIDAFSSSLFYPLMYLYFKSSTSEKPFEWKDFLWFIPALMLGCGTSILYAMMGEQDAIAYTRQYRSGPPFAPEYSTALYRAHRFLSVDVYNFLIIVQTICVSLYTFILTIRYHLRLKDFYSNLDDKSMEVDRSILRFFLFSTVLSAVLACTGHAFWREKTVATVLFYIAWAATYLGLGFHSCKTKYTVDQLAVDLQKADCDEKSYMTDPMESLKQVSRSSGENSTYKQTAKFTTLLTTIDQLIDTERLFLKTDLRIDELAHLMSTNRLYVSQVIKEKHRCSFSDYINRKRVGYAMQQMRSHPEMKQSELAEVSGFLSASTFNKAFKQVSGTTPKEWYANDVLQKEQAVS